MRSEWQIFSCDRCGKAFKRRTDKEILNNRYEKTYRVEAVVDDKANYKDICSLECCIAHVNELLSTGLCSDMSISRRSLHYYDEAEDNSKEENV